MENLQNEIGKIDISGDTICPEWFSHIKKRSGSPDLMAIMLLSNIIWWYTPIKGRSETTGRPLPYKSKFPGTYLQKTYDQYSEYYSVKTENIVSAFDTLEKLRLVFRSFIEGSDKSGLFYIIPNPKEIMKITHGEFFSDSDINIPKKPAPKESPAYKEQAEEVINHLNKCRKEISKNKNLRGYRAVEGNNLRLIRARLKEGHTVEDFQKVIDYKCWQWQGTKFEAYLQPSTLFSAGHFSNYLAEADCRKKPEPTKLDEQINSLMG